MTTARLDSPALRTPGRLCLCFCFCLRSGMRALRVMRVLALLLLTLPGIAQELQPRRWSHLPMDTNFAGLGYAYTKADISFNPALRIEDGELDMHTFAFNYIRSFEMFGKSARFDLVQTYQDGRWIGLLDGTPASTSRSGLGDTIVRFSANLIGAPPLKGKEFAAYRAATDCETILGVGLTAQLPTGHYIKERLLNLGHNRFTIRPQIGFVHNHGKWSAEFTTATWFRTDNNSFYQGNKLEQDPLYTAQGHLIYTFRPGLWLATGVAYGFGGRSEVNDTRLADRNSILVWGLSLGIPVNRKFGFKVGYIGSHSLERSGADTHTISAGCRVIW